MREELKYKKGCLICGNELIYKNKEEKQKCFYCKQTYVANVKCSDGHYICDKCHLMTGNEIIKNHCISTTSTKPLEIAIDLMKHPAIKMHGPEHHFLIPAVLLSAYYNKTNNTFAKETKIKQAQIRSEKILGGFCGSHENCGAAVGTGIFTSLILNTTPLSTENWKESNIMTAQALEVIAKNGGPRCCKRNTFLAITLAIEKHINDFPESGNIKCNFNKINKECRKEKCLFFAN